jgi:hypothetical protein
MQRRGIATIACIVSVLGSEGCASAPPPPPQPAPFSTIYLVPTTLRVGYHTVVGAHAEGCPFQGEGQPTWTSTSTQVEGTLPPGLQLLDGPPRIEGTPRQPGTWTITYVLRGVSCIGNPSVDYGDRRVRVVFTVNP